MSFSRKEALEGVLAIIRRIAADEAVMPDSEIYGRWRISGDDASEMLKEISSTFGTDLSALPFGDYFPEEMESLGANFLRFFGHKSRWKSLTPNDLVESVLAGHWIAPKQ
jgi:hypothetical protein